MSARTSLTSPTKFAAPGIEVLGTEPAVMQVIPLCLNILVGIRGVGQQPGQYDVVEKLAIATARRLNSDEQGNPCAVIGEPVVVEVNRTHTAGEQVHVFRQMRAHHVVDACGC